ncbi:MAG: RNA 2',3'-cyclic phosphodiesterase [Actinobacteria bacterium HGW-Actinobacteria-9]|jgi:2'-5' RNA ligase|nr:MAG: RNA 2',3'-cyclic phosphodiesterase [Actinobacteria bacterium HGW-Actinobacteria-9]
MRVFIGIDLDDTWRAALRAGCETIRRTDPAWHDEKWVPGENLHMTLKFMGDVPDESVEYLGPDLEKALGDSRSFSLPVARLVYPAPERRKATMLWTTFRDPDDAAASLLSRIEDVAADYGVVPESRFFNPHVTLVRARRPHPFTAEEPALAAMASVLGPIDSMSVGEVTVFSSTLTRATPVYRRLAKIRLTD